MINNCETYRIQRQTWRSAWRAALLIAFLCSMAGRALAQDSEPDATGPPAESASAATTSASRVAAVPLIDGKRFHELLNRMKGKVVVVNMWATWCVPCRQEFPGLVELYHNYKTKGLEVIAIANDDVQNLDDVKDFIKTNKADFKTFIADPKDLGGLHEAVSPHWTGGLPSSFLFDRDGELKKTVMGGRSLQEFEELLKPLLR
ncbi:MAG: TlpA disulfide reductase family protein [Acidobacteriia bacterium]|nr:TlpA disulfide reductase family protein [Terriglobia bacterium]